MPNKKYIISAMFLLLGFFVAGCAKPTAVNIEQKDGYLPGAQSKNYLEQLPKETAKMPTPKQTATESEIKQTNKNMTTQTNLALVKKYKKAILHTNFGKITVQFHGEESPITVNNFLKLSLEKFYDGTKFHRVIKDFMIQGGDPNSKDDDWSNDGQGGPGYKFDDEFNTHKLVKGSLAMANAGANSNGSQFFIVTADATPWLDGKHTNFGEVIEGMEVVEKIENVEKNQNDHPTKDVVIEKVELLEK
jgi:peptidyl-prolyl cis-trans isomerase B (cyclophilin B)